MAPAEAGHITNLTPCSHHDVDGITDVASSTMAEPTKNQADLPHVLIVGAGLAGLTLVQSLRKQGITYDIFERDKDIEARAGGWAIAVHTCVLFLQ